MEKRFKITEQKIQYVYLCFLGITLLFCILSVLHPHENYHFDTRKFQLLDEGWEQLYPDGRRETISLSAVREQEGRVVLERRLPDALPCEDAKLFLHSMHQNVQLFLNGEELYRYEYQDRALLSKSCAPVQWLRIPLPENSGGGQLRILLTRHGYHADAPADRIYLGETSAVLYELARRNIPQLLSSVMLLAAGGIILLEALFLKRRRAGFMGFYLFFIGLWILCQSEVRQLFFGNIVLIRNLEFLSMLLIPIPGLLTINELENGLYQEEIYRLCLADTLLLSVVGGLFLFTELNFMDMLYLVEAGILLAGGYMALNFLRLYRRDRVLFHALRNVILAHIFLILAGLLELFSLNVLNATHQGWILSLGAAGFGIEMTLSHIRRYEQILRERELLESREKMKSEFLASMSHEIRTPINVMLGMNELVLRDSNEERIRSFARDIKTAGDSLLSIINEILEYSRIESGQRRNVEKPFSFGELLADIVTLIRFRAEQKGLRFELQISEELPRMLGGNCFWLREILMNLLDNAVKYTEKGVVQLSIELVRAEKAGLKLSGEKQGCPVLRLSVRDTGIGIREENQQAIFRRFTRDSGEWKNYIQGTGLGLAITEQYIRHLEGRIELTSRLGEGSTFTAYIPVRPLGEERIGDFALYSAALEERRGVGFVKLRLPDVRLLVVDDSGLNLRLMQELLRPTGAELDTAWNGRQAMELLRKGNYDLVFLDDLMMGQSGTELLRRIRAEKLKTGQGTPLPVVAFTANAMPGAREQYLAAGFDAYLSKPAKWQDIADRLRELLSRELVRTEEKRGFRPVEPGSMEMQIFDPAVGRKYCMEDEEVFREMLELFCGSYEERRSGLLRALDKADWAQYELLSHSLKSTALTVGALRLSNGCLRLEHAAKSCQQEAEREEAVRYLLSHTGTVLGLFKRTLQEMRQYLKQSAETEIHDTEKGFRAE